MNSVSDLEKLQHFFERSICQQTGSYLKEGVEIRLELPDAPSLSLKKTATKLELLTEIPRQPDMTFYLGKEIPRLLSGLTFEKPAEIGLSLLDMVLSNEEDTKIRIKIHIDSFGMIRNGYFRVLASGGSPLMNRLGKFGLGNFSKIKTIISQLRS